MRPLWAITTKMIVEGLRMKITLVFIPVLYTLFERREPHTAAE